MFIVRHYSAIKKPTIIQFDQFFSYKWSGREEKKFVEATVYDFKNNNKTIHYPYFNIKNLKTLYSLTYKIFKYLNI